MPRQHRRCTVYPWCTGHAGPNDSEHRSSAHVVAAQDGRELRFVLTGTGDGPLRVTVELLLIEGGPPLEVVELDPVEVLQAAAVLRQLAMESRERVEQ
jgi:hypothetical protein